jgi:hypothetical protein
MKKLILLMLLSLDGYCIVKYDEGRLMINGVQLLQDLKDPTAYYYLPQFPRIARKDDNSFEFLCIKYVSKASNENNGGIFHALIEFSLTDEMIQSIETELKKKVPGAKIAGPVPMQQAMVDGEDGMANIKVVSAIMNEGENNKFLKGKVLTSTFAPFLPKSRAAIAVNLNQEGATLLWESFKGNTSDVSVSLQGYYEAYVQGYNASVSVEVSTLYAHFSKIMSNQEGFDKSQIRKVVDDLQQSQVMKVEVFDRSEGLGIKADNMQKILDLVTEKLTTLLFDSQNGWAVLPEKEKAVEKGQLAGRQQAGWLNRLFRGVENNAYYTDHQFVLKDIKDIRTRQFYLNLSKATSIKVPVFASGNLSGLYNELTTQSPDKYFRTVFLDDPDFQKREVTFQLDGSFAETFSDLLNFVSVTFRKEYPTGESDVSEDIVIRKTDVEKGSDLKIVKYPRLGLKGENWLDYQYKIDWSLKGNNISIREPADSNGWIKANGSSVILVPPFKKRVVELEFDKNTMKDRGYISANIRFFVVLNKQPQTQKSFSLKQSDASASLKFSLFHDNNETVAYQITWYGNAGKVEEDLKELARGENYLYLQTPATSQLQK